MDPNSSTAEETGQLKAGLEHLRSELSYAKTHNSEWFEAFLKRIDTTNNNIKSLQRTILWFGWIFLLITIAVLAILFLNEVLVMPTLEDVINGLGFV